MNTYFSDSDKISSGSSLIILDLYDMDGIPINVSQTEKPIMIQIPQKISSSTPVPQLTTGDMSASDPRVSLSYFQTNVTNNDFSLTIEIVPVNKSVQLLVLVRYNEYPDLNTTDTTTRGWDYLQLVPANFTNIGESFSFKIIRHIIYRDEYTVHWLPDI